MKIASRHLQLLAALATSLLLALPASALAGSSSPTAGVHVDPSSPVAKEYALPLATARGAPADTGSTGSLFGAGVNSRRAGRQDRTSTVTTTSTEPSVSQTRPTVDTTPDPVVSTSPTPITSTQTPSAATTSAPTHRAVRHPHRRHRRRAPKPAAALPAPLHRAGSPSRSTTPPAALRILHSGTGASWLWMLLAAAAVLAPGCAGALLMRTRRHRLASYSN